MHLTVNNNTSMICIIDGSRSKNQSSSRKPETFDWSIEIFGNLNHDFSSEHLKQSE